MATKEKKPTKPKLKRYPKLGKTQTLVAVKAWYKRCEDVHKQNATKLKKYFVLEKEYNKKLAEITKLKAGVSKMKTSN